MDIQGLEQIKEAYLNTLKKLQEISVGGDKIINIPISPVGFIQGQIKNPSEIMVCLSSEFSIKTDLQGSE